MKAEQVPWYKWSTFDTADTWYNWSTLDRRQPDQRVLLEVIDQGYTPKQVETYLENKWDKVYDVSSKILSSGEDLIESVGTGSKNIAEGLSWGLPLALVVFAGVAAYQYTPTSSSRK